MTDKEPHPRLQRFIDTLRAQHTEAELELRYELWTVQTKAARKRRLEAIIQLSIELGEIRKIDLFATTFGEIVIEKLIEGDLKDARAYAGFMDFASEGEDLRARYVPIWAKFREMALAAAKADEDIQ